MKSSRRLVFFSLAFLRFNSDYQRKISGLLAKNTRQRLRTFSLVRTNTLGFSISFPNVSILYHERNWQTSGKKTHHSSGRISIHVSKNFGKKLYRTIITHASRTSSRRWSGAVAPWTQPRSGCSAVRSILSTKFEPKSKALFSIRLFFSSSSFRPQQSREKLFTNFILPNLSMSLLFEYIDDEKKFSNKEETLCGTKVSRKEWS